MHGLPDLAIPGGVAVGLGRGDRSAGDGRPGGLLRVDDRVGAVTDNPDGEISDIEGDYGFFTPSSWWPLALGFSSALAFAGLAVGWWLFMIAFVIGCVSLVGWTFEHFKGDYAN